MPNRSPCSAFGCYRQLPASWGISGVDVPRTFMVAVVIPAAAFTFNQE
ncbi:hypothetical protein [Leucobacter komagatae]|nr:hypothetical protein [Leucobacter komagatae]